MAEIIKLITSGIIGGLIALFTPFIRRLIWGPKLELYFGNEIEGCVAKTPITIINKKQEISNITEGFYIRILVVNTKYALARDCRGFLVNIEKQGEDGKFHHTIFCDSIQAQWACRSGQGFNGIDLPKGINQFIDIISTIKGNDCIHPKIEMFPDRYKILFSEVGTFRYTVQVSGNEVNPETIKFIFKWKGRWNDFEVDIDTEKFPATDRYINNLYYQLKDIIKKILSK